MVRDAPGELVFGQAKRFERHSDEVERPAAVVSHRERRHVIGAHEPGDLIVEFVFFRLFRVAEDGARDFVQIVGGEQTGGGERLIEQVVLAVNVEIAQGDQALMSRAQSAIHSAMALTSGRRSSAFLP